MNRVQAAAALRRQAEAEHQAEERPYIGAVTKYNPKTDRWEDVAAVKSTAQAIAWISAVGPLHGGRYKARTLDPCPLCRNFGHVGGILSCDCIAGKEEAAKLAALEA